jgi:glycosyltransferase involved in cell wall biosynthesis
LDKGGPIYDALLFGGIELLKKLVFVVNVDWFFMSHRLAIAAAAVQAGYEVSLISTNTGCFEKIESRGLKTIHIPLERSGTGIHHELIYVLRLFWALKKIRPDIIHNSTLKPVIYGSFIGFLIGKPVVNAISGLGFNLNETNKGLKKWVMVQLMRIALKHRRNRFIFQNEDDKRVLSDLRILGSSPTFLIKGVGVDLVDFHETQFPNKKKLEVLLPARMLYDKGIFEFIEAARLLQQKYFGRVEWVLAGRVDADNLASLKEEDLREAEIPGYISWVGHQENIKDWLIKSDIVVLPSYREGMPKSLIEACAIGRPIVTTDAIGCRECVDEGVNGFKVPIKDAKSLAEAIDKLLSDSYLIEQMGKASRLKAEHEFDVNQVIQKHLDIYQSILN